MNGDWDFSVPLDPVGTYQLSCSGIGMDGVDLMGGMEGSMGNSINANVG